MVIPHLQTKSCSCYVSIVLKSTWDAQWNFAVICHGAGTNRAASVQNWKQILSEVFWISIQIEGTGKQFAVFSGFTKQVEQIDLWAVL